MMSELFQTGDSIAELYFLSLKQLKKYRNVSFLYQSETNESLCINLEPVKAFVSIWNQWKPLYQSGTNENLCIIHYDFQNVGALLTQKVSKDIMVCTKW